MFAFFQFVDDQAARVLSWLPRKLAPQVRIIFSSIENSQQHETLLKRETKPIEINIAPLDVESRKVTSKRKKNNLVQTLEAGEVFTILKDFNRLLHCVDFPLSLMKLDNISLGQSYLFDS